MKYRVEFTPQAESDLRKFYEYIAFLLLEPQIALAQISRVEKAIYTLDEMPERFKLYEREPWRGRGLRQMPVDNFIVFYIPRDEKRTVTIIRVLYGGRDIGEQLKNERNHNS